MTRHRHAGVHGVYTIPSRWTRAVLPSRPGRTRAGTKTKPSPQGLFAVYVRGRRAQPHSSHSSHCRSKARTHLLQLWRRARGRRLGLAFVLAVLGLLLLIALVPLLLLLLRSPPPPSRRSQARPRRPLPCLSVTTWLADRQSPPSHCTCDGLLLRLRPFPPPRAGVSDDTATIDGRTTLCSLSPFSFCHAAAHHQRMHVRRPHTSPPAGQSPMCPRRPSSLTFQPAAARTAVTVARVDPDTSRGKACHVPFQPTRRGSSIGRAADRRLQGGGARAPHLLLLLLLLLLFLVISAAHRNDTQPGRRRCLATQGAVWDALRRRDHGSSSAWATACRGCDTCRPSHTQSRSRPRAPHAHRTTRTTCAGKQRAVGAYHGRVHGYRTRSRRLPGHGGLVRPLFRCPATPNPRRRPRLRRVTRTRR